MDVKTVFWLWYICCIFILLNIILFKFCESCLWRNLRNLWKLFCQLLISSSIFRHKLPKVHWNVILSPQDWREFFTEFTEVQFIYIICKMLCKDKIVVSKHKIVLCQPYCSNLWRKWQSVMHYFYELLISTIVFCDSSYCNSLNIWFLFCLQSLTVICLRRLYSFDC